MGCQHLERVMNPFATNFASLSDIFWLKVVLAPSWIIAQETTQKTVVARRCPKVTSS